MNSDITLGQKYYSLFNYTYEYCGHNELINTLLIVYMENGKNECRIYLFGNLERNKTTSNLDKSFTCLVTTLFDFLFYFCVQLTFLDIAVVNPHETTTCPLGTPRGLKACCIC